MSRRRIEPEQADLAQSQGEARAGGADDASESAFERREYLENDVIVQEGERGDEFFVIESGFADVFINGEFIREMGPAAHFGELALQIYGSLRSATVIAASTPTVVLVVSRRNFKNTIKPNMPRFQKLGKHKSGNGGYGEQAEGLGDVLASLLLSNSGIGLREAAFNSNGGIGQVFAADGAKSQRGKAAETLSFSVQVSMLLWLLALVLYVGALVVVIFDLRPWSVCFGCSAGAPSWIWIFAAAAILIFAAALIVSAIQAQIPGFDPRSPCDPRFVVSRKRDRGYRGEAGGQADVLEFESPL
jgi:hypothetical protein